MGLKKMNALFNGDGYELVVELWDEHGELRRRTYEGVAVGPGPAFALTLGAGSKGNLSEAFGNEDQDVVLPFAAAGQECPVSAKGSNSFSQMFLKRISFSHCLSKWKEANFLLRRNVLLGLAGEGQRPPAGGEKRACVRGERYKWK